VLLAFACPAFEGSVPCGSTPRCRSRCIILARLWSRSKDSFAQSCTAPGARRSHAPPMKKRACVAPLRGKLQQGIIACSWACIWPEICRPASF